MGALNTGFHIVNLHRPTTAMSTPVPSRASAVDQGLTFVHLSAQRKRFWWDKVYLGGF